ncbi:MAG: aminotransferase class IV [Gemmataceae bacterium]|nr:aminotransferase class IV [Gemmataceae bacterium]
MTAAMNAPLAYLNGRFLPFTEAALPLHDAGFVSGATVVDNARTFRHKLFRWPDHLARFRRDCGTCYVPLDATDEQLTATAEELVAHNARLLPPGGELQLITFATPGPLGFYLGDAPSGPPTLGVVTYPLPFARYRRFFTEGVTLVVVSQAREKWGSVLPPTVKHRSRLYWHIADRMARARSGRADALALLMELPDLTETSVANLLAVADGAVRTPPRASVLDGISLRVTAELCAGRGIGFTEQAVGMHELAGDLSEVMLTGTGFCLAGVREVWWEGRQRPLLVDWPGPVFRRLLAAWSDLVGLDIERQFLDAPG